MRDSLFFFKNITKIDAVAKIAGIHHQLFPYTHFPVFAIIPQGFLIINCIID
jgi:hypothetical protein